MGRSLNHPRYQDLCNVEYSLPAAKALAKHVRRVAALSPTSPNYDSQFLYRRKRCRCEGICLLSYPIVSLSQLRKITNRGQCSEILFGSIVSSNLLA